MDQTRHEIEARGRRSINWLRALGVFWIILGSIAVVATFAATMATVLLIGVLLLLAGLGQFAQLWADRSPHPGWQLLTGALYSVAGVLLILDPVSGAIGLTLLIAILFLAGGALRLAMAVTARGLGFPAGWHLAGGVLNLILAALIFAGWPETGTWVIGLFVGIELLFGGLTLLLAPITIFDFFGSD